MGEPLTQALTDEQRDFLERVSQRLQASAGAPTEQEQDLIERWHRQVHPPSPYLTEEQVREGRRLHSAMTRAGAGKDIAAFLTARANLTAWQRKHYPRLASARTREWGRTPKPYAELERDRVTRKLMAPREDAGRLVLMRPKDVNKAFQALAPLATDEELRASAEKVNWKSLMRKAPRGTPGFWRGELGKNKVLWKFYANIELVRRGAQKLSSLAQEYVRQGRLETDPEDLWRAAKRQASEYPLPQNAREIFLNSLQEWKKHKRIVDAAASYALKRPSFFRRTVTGVGDLGAMSDEDFQRFAIVFTQNLPKHVRRGGLEAVQVAARRGVAKSLADLLYLGRQAITGLAILRTETPRGRWAVREAEEAAYRNELARKRVELLRGLAEMKDPVQADTVLRKIFVGAAGMAGAMVPAALATILGGPAGFGVVWAAQQMPENIDLMMEHGLGTTAAVAMGSSLSVVDAVLEHLQFTGLLPKGLTGVIRNRVLRSLLNYAGKAAKAYGQEWGEEFLQAGAGIVFQETANVLSGRGIRLGPQAWDELEGALTSGYSLLGMMVPGWAVGGVQVGRRARQQARIARVVKEARKSAERTARGEPPAPPAPPAAPTEVPPAPPAPPAPPTEVPAAEAAPTEVMSAEAPLPGVPPAPPTELLPAPPAPPTELTATELTPAELVPTELAPAELAPAELTAEMPERVEERRETEEVTRAEKAPPEAGKESPEVAEARETEGLEGIRVRHVAEGREAAEGEAEAEAEVPVVTGEAKEMAAAVAMRPTTHRLAAEHARDLELALSQIRKVNSEAAEAFAERIQKAVKMDETARGLGMDDLADVAKDMLAFKSRPPAAAPAIKGGPPPAELTPDAAAELPPEQRSYRLPTPKAPAPPTAEKATPEAHPEVYKRGLPPSPELRAQEERAEQKLVLHRGLPKPYKAQGRYVTVKPEGEEELETRYALIERADIIGSHEYNGGLFTPHPDYPTPEKGGPQTRNYREDQGEQEKVRARSAPGRFAPDQLLQKTTATQLGPPILDLDGRVIDGSGRNLLLERLSHEGRFDEYRKPARKTAEAVGLDLDVFDGMKEPVIVRVTGASVTSEVGGRVARAANIPIIGVMDAVGLASQFKGQLPEGILDGVELREDETLTAVLNRPQHAKTRKTIAAAIKSNNLRKQIFDTNTGLIKNIPAFRAMFLLNIFGEDAVRTLMAHPQFHKTIESGLAALYKIKREHEGLTVIASLEEAITAVVSRFGEKMGEDEKQMPLFPSGISPEASMFIEYFMKPPPSKKAPGWRVPIAFRTNMAAIARGIERAETALQSNLQNIETGEIALGEVDVAQVVADNLDVEVAESATFEEKPAPVKKAAPTEQKPAPAKKAAPTEQKMLRSKAPTNGLPLLTTDDISAALPGVKVTEVDSTTWRCKLPDGEVFIIEHTGELQIREKALEEEREREVKAGRERLAGLFVLKTYMSNEKIIDTIGIVQLLQGAAQTSTLRHEMVHFAWHMGYFTPEQKRALVKKYAPGIEGAKAQEEAVAYALEKRPQSDGLWAGIMRMLRRLWRALGGGWSAAAVADALETGAVWRQKRGPVTPIGAPLAATAVYEGKERVKASAKAARERRALRPGEIDEAIRALEAEGSPEVQEKMKKVLSVGPFEKRAVELLRLLITSAKPEMMPRYSQARRLAMRAAFVLGKAMRDEASMEDLSVSEKTQIARALQSLLHASRKTALHKSDAVECRDKLNSWTRGETKAPIDKRAGPLLKTFGLDLQSLNCIVELLGGPDGPIFDRLFWDLHEGVGRQMEMEDDVEDAYVGIFTGLGLKRKDIPFLMEQEVDATLGGERLQRGELIRILHSCMDSYAWREMCKKDHMGWTLVRNGQPVVREVNLTPEQVNDWFADYPLETKIALETHLLMNGPKVTGRLAEVYQKDVGVRAMYRGDWCDLRRDPSYTETEMPGVMQRFTGYTMSDFSWHKPRSSNNAPFMVENDLNATRRTVRQAAMYYGRELPFKRAQALMYESSFADRIARLKRYGADIVDTIRKNLKSYGEIDLTGSLPGEGLIRSMVKRGQLAALAYKVQILLYQLVSDIGLIDEFGIRAWADPRMRLRGLTPAMWKRMRRISPWLARRYRAAGEGLLTPYLANEGWLGPRRGVLARGAYGLLKMMDRMPIGHAWAMAEAEATKLGLQGDAFDAYVKKRAEMAVVHTQPTWNEHTMNQLQIAGRRNPLFGLLTLFSSQVAKHPQMAFRAISRWQHSNHTAADFGRLVAGTAIPLLGSPLLIYGISEAWWWAVSGRGRRPREHIVRGLERVFGNWMLARDILSIITNVAEHAMAKEPIDWARPRANLLMGAITDTIMSSGKLMVALKQRATEEYVTRGPNWGKRKGDWLAKRALEQLLRGAGVLAGLPTPAALQLTTRWRIEKPTSLDDFYAARRRFKKEYEELKGRRSARMKGLMQYIKQVEKRMSEQRVRARKRGTPEAYKLARQYLLNIAAEAVRAMNAEREARIEWESSRQTPPS